jgi:hypothetical protein
MMLQGDEKVLEVVDKYTQASGTVLERGEVTMLQGL